ncbi:Chaperone protein HscA [Novipirellula aureliae]|uniref:Chaperone protein HscA n=1 Tax=Novipirellula aureliae TaxID=2527966 RepID=A0A5C6ECF9_9BACT|nr:hsp70 family protein [Novipirellula aureliae]TWU45226.1 Chaperone protein HscA [Novipirellula aureliae]
MSNNSPNITDDLLPAASRYVVGIDLGTTNCAVCFVDTADESWGVETFKIPQWVDFGQREQRDTLPSFHYELTAEEAASDHRLPWQTSPSNHCVGVLARDAGGRHPGRRAASAKSWLCHEGVDRTSDLLPWHGDADVTRLSPVEASSRYLNHLRSAWDQANPDNPLCDQDVVITLPASFDEVARELTVKAAKQAGLPRVYLIEEPQAAFYSWIDRQGDDWQTRVSPGQLILVCDIGGGTTDLTLIRVRKAGEMGDQVQFHRVAVGRHLILGGDNLDLAVARMAEAKLIASGGAGTDSQLAADQWDRLVQVSRSVKEVMLSSNRPDTYTIHLPSQGSKLVGGSMQVQVTAPEIDQTLLDGFFPDVLLGEKPTSGESGFQEFGLPYASDPAVTRHLAAFLSEHRRSGLDADEMDAADRPDLVLFNGGVMTAPAIRSRIVNLLSKWFGESSDWKPEVLSSPRLDLAVAHGAAYYGMVRRGEGVRIAANLGRSYYMQVAASNAPNSEGPDPDTQPCQALCLIPGKAEPGQRFRADGNPLRLKIGTPVQFPLWVSSTRLADSVGELVQIDRTEMSPLPPICTALVQGKKRLDEEVKVVIEAELSEIGTIGLFCVDAESNKRWRLEFDIRSTLETDREAHTGSGEASGIIDAETMEQCGHAIASVFLNADSTTRQPPNKLVKTLQSISELSRNRWPPSLLRDMWQSLIENEQGRRQSAQHEARWLNLVGFCLRPGYGVAVDDWRVAQTWRVIHGKLAFPALSSRTESMILWRRIAGGLTSGQQEQLAAPLISLLKNKTRRIEAHEASEMWRMLGAMERLHVKAKVELGLLALAAMKQKKNENLRPALLWALGRLGSRQGAYGPLNATVPVEEASRWAGELLDGASSRGEDLFGFAENQNLLLLSIVQMARKTGDRHRDFSNQRREAMAVQLELLGANEHLVKLLTVGGTLQSDEEAVIFGDSLPLGIRLMR